MNLKDFAKVLRGIAHQGHEAIFVGTSTNLQKLSRALRSKIATIEFAGPGDIPSQVNPRRFLVFGSQENLAQVPELYLRVNVGEERSRILVSNKKYSEQETEFETNDLIDAIQNLLPLSQNEELRPALFLDRDGIVIEYEPYLSKPSQVKLRPEILPLLRHCNDRDVPVIVVSNQSGLGRGLFGERDHFLVTQKIKRELASKNLFIDHFSHAAFYAEGTPDLSCAGYFDRKPLPGMILRAAEEWHLNLPRSWILGDRLSDAEAGRYADVAHRVLCNDKEKYASEFTGHSGPKTKIFLSLEACVNHLILEISGNT